MHFLVVQNPGETHRVVSRQKDVTQASRSKRDA
jgi:hypothetical protein